MVNIAVHQTTKISMSLKEPNAMEVKFSWIVCAAVMMNTKNAHLEFVQMQVEYYKDKYKELYFWKIIYIIIDNLLFDINNMQFYLVTSGVIVTSHGNSADSPHCSWWATCEYTDATKQECATALCRAQGYGRATFLSASNNFCRSTFEWENAYLYRIDRDKIEYGYGNDAQITAKCYSGK